MKRRAIAKSWKLAWELVQVSSVNHFKKTDEIAKVAGCDKWVPNAFFKLGYIQKNADGYLRPTAMSPDWGKIRRYVNEKYHYKTPNLPPESPQLFAPENEQRNTGANVAQVAQTYTRDQVIEAFKAFYVKEYGRLTDDAYRMIGFLMSALD